VVKLNKIYTKTGDDGTTALGAGGRVAKTDPRVEAYGDVDEANAAIGLAVIQADGPVGDLLRSIQNDLFDVGGDLCVPTDPHEGSDRLRVTPAQTERLEREIDACNERLSPLNSFVIPGGSPLSAGLHAARTVVRRAERRVAGLIEAQPDSTGTEPLKYLNRLSDLLFVLGRAANRDGADDVLWKPGANRADTDTPST